MKLKRILEFTEFSDQRLIANPSIRNVARETDDPQLSFDSYDKFSTNSEIANRKLTDIYVNVLAANINNSNRSEFDTLYSVLSNIKELTILRIFFNDSITATVYFSFKYEDVEYYGQILAFNTKEPTFRCEFLHNISPFRNREAHIKIKGIIIKAISKWLNVSHGDYTALKDFFAINIKTGKQCLFKEKTIINVVLSSDSEIVFLYKGEKYRIDGKQYYYFNYFFENVKK